MVVKPCMCVREGNRAVLAMGLRYRRKSVRFGRFVRLNLSGSGVSLGLGPRGANVNVSRRGLRKTVGIPGTGLSYQTFFEVAWQGSIRNPQPTSVAGPTGKTQRNGHGISRLLLVVEIILGVYYLVRSETSPSSVVRETAKPARTELEPPLVSPAVDAKTASTARATPEYRAPRRAANLWMSMKSAKYKVGSKPSRLILARVVELPGPLTTAAIERTRALDKCP